MSVNVPKISVIRLLAVKVETTTGTEETVSATDAQLIVYDPKIERDANTNERQLMAAKGQSASTIGVQSGTATFRIELASGATAGTSPAWATSCLPPCDMSETSGTWAFASTGQTVTISLFEDGAKRTLYGARGTFKITKENGKNGYVEFTFKGKYKEDTDTAILSPTFPTVLPDPNHDTLTIGSFSPVFTKVEIDAGNDVQLRENANASDGTCLYGAAIINRKPMGTVDPEQSALATQDWNALVNSGAEQSYSMAVGGTSTNIITIASSHAQVRSTTRGDRNGIVTREVNVAFNTASPFTIAFS